MKSLIIRPELWDDREIGRDKGYFELRYINLDLRGPLQISALSHWGYFITVITYSHDISQGVDVEEIGPKVERGVIVEEKAWIGSGSLLYNCRVGRAAVVAAGTVLRSCEVAPGVMVAGNPARVIARWRYGRWRYLNPEERWMDLK